MRETYDIWMCAVLLACLGTYLPLQGRDGLSGRLLPHAQRVDADLLNMLQRPDFTYRRVRTGRGTELTPAYGREATLAVVALSTSAGGKDRGLACGHGGGRHVEDEAEASRRHLT